MIDHSDLTQRLRQLNLKYGDEAADVIEILEGTINRIFAKLAAQDRAMDKIRSLLYKGPYEPIELSDADKEKCGRLFEKVELDFERELEVQKALEEMMSRNNGIVN